MDKHRLPEKAQSFAHKVDNAQVRDSPKTESSTGKIEEKIEQVEEPPPPSYRLRNVLDEIDQFVSIFPAKSKEEIDKEFQIPAFVEEFLDLIDQNISKYGTKWSRAAEEEGSLFIDTVDQISKLNAAVIDFTSTGKHGALINRIGDLQQQVMTNLEDEFKLLLEDCRCNEHETPNGHDDNFPDYADDVLVNLNRMAKEIISAGHESECCEVYMIARREAFDECLNNIGFGKISMDDVQKMQWEVLETEIATWSTTFKKCTTVYFPGERKLAEAVFTDFPSLAASLFSNLTRGVLIQLLNFAEGMAMLKISQDKLFKFLDIYETLRDSLTEIDELFDEECANELKTETTSTRRRIGEAIISTFSDLENSIKSDITGKTPVPCGAVHPLTRYTMNYLTYACEYKDTLEQVFKEHSKMDEAQPFSSQLMRVMDLLDANLESKARLYRDTSLGSIFMMNNGRYILQKIKGSVAIHDDTWHRKRSYDLRNFHKGYQRETWSKVLGCLSHEGIQVNGKVVKPVLKERFKSFNAMFEEIHKTQSCWIVSDEQLQSELRVSISALVIPAYRAFFGRFSHYLDTGRQSDKYVKLQPEDIENAIEELFDGKPASMARRKS